MKTTAAARSRLELAGVKCLSPVHGRRAVVRAHIHTNRTLRRRSAAAVCPVVVKSASSALGRGQGVIANGGDSRYSGPLYCFCSAQRACLFALASLLSAVYELAGPECACSLHMRPLHSC